MKLAQRIYFWAGIYGLVVLLPMYFLETRLGRDTPPPVTHPEFFYGFVGLAVVWQLAFLVIARDPCRYRPLMPITWLEKLSFGGAIVVLLAQGRVSGAIVFGGLADLVLGALFVWAWRSCPAASA